jgi:hypothetical protein
MITNEEIAKIVEGIANKYAKDIVRGTPWRYDVFEEYRQELYVKAYELISNDPEVSIQLVARSLWNRATDLFRSSEKKLYNEWSTHILSGTRDMDEDPDESSNLINYLASESTDYTSSDEYSNDLVERVLDITSKLDQDIRDYVIAKLKLNGYLSKDSYPNIKINVEDYDNSSETENCKILKDVLGMNQAETGGTVKFKSAKRSLLLDLMSEFELEDCYRKWYIARYKNSSSEFVEVRVKKYSKVEVENYLESLDDFYQVDQIVLED